MTKSGLNNKMLKIIFVFLLFFSFNLNEQTDSIQTDVPALKNVYANDFYIGCLLSYRNVGLPTNHYMPGQSNIESEYISDS